jgi:hypothetical protein
MEVQVIVSSSDAQARATILALLTGLLRKSGIKHDLSIMKDQQSFMPESETDVNELVEVIAANESLEITICEELPVSHDDMAVDDLKEMFGICVECLSQT